MKCWRSPLIHGVDTGYLVAAELREHPAHSQTRAQLEQLIGQGAILVLAPQVLLEFIHVVTDPKRFAAPLSVEMARMLAQKWWTATEVRHAFPDGEDEEILRVARPFQARA
jgi:predicted nucleic acid-binding protein